MGVRIVVDILLSDLYGNDLLSPIICTLKQLGMVYKRIYLCVLHIISYVEFTIRQP